MMCMGKCELNNIHSKSQMMNHVDHIMNNMGRCINQHKTDEAQTGGVTILPLYMEYVVVFTPNI